MTQEAKIVMGVSIVSLLILVAGVFFMSRNSDMKPAESTSVDLNILNRNAINKTSSDSGKITIVEFADLQCPACANANPSIKQVIDEYSKDVTLVYRHFPLPQHSNAMIAAKAAEATGEQGKFFEMAQKMYAEQSRWERQSSPEEIFISYAEDLKLDKEKFTNDMKSTKYDERIEQDKSDGIRLGVNATPTLFINGQLLNEAPSYENIKKAILLQL